MPVQELALELGGGALVPLPRLLRDVLRHRRVHGRERRPGPQGLGGGVGVIRKHRNIGGPKEIDTGSQMCKGCENDSKSQKKNSKKSGGGRGWGSDFTNIGEMGGKYGETDVSSCEFKMAKSTSQRDFEKTAKMKKTFTKY